MARWYLGAVLVVVSFVGSVALGQSQATKPELTKVSTASPASAPSDYRPLINAYCVVCHNQNLKTAGLMLDKADLAKVPEQKDIWEKVERKLRAGLMPPQGMPHPDKAKVDAFASSLEDQLDRAAQTNPNPGPALLRRLTRTEYGNAVRDLLDLDVDVTSLLPGEGYSNEGFDNDAAALNVSPVLMEQYLSAAWEVSSLAAGSSKPGVSIDTFKIRPDLSQDSHIDGLPVGTRGGILVHYNFPADGEYVFKPIVWRNNAKQVRGIEHPTQFVVTVDGVKVHEAEYGGAVDEAFSLNAHLTAGQVIDKRMETHLAIKAGPHDIGFAFLKPSSAVPIGLIQPLQRENLNGSENSGISVLSQVSIVGPMNPTGPGDTPSRRQIFVCRPSKDDGDKDACAKKILAKLARLAYRRPATKEEMQQLLQLYALGLKQGGPENGVETALTYILASPQFVFRMEQDPANVPANVAFRVDDYDLATRLSFFLWSSIPDDQLLTLAGEGKLRNPAILDQQVKRMLDDPKSSALVTNFADEWLHLRNLKVAAPIDVLFPDFDDNLRTSFQRETELFFESILRENRNVLDLLRANYTFLNERLAANYGIPNVYGSQFRRVTLTDENRFGLLGQGSVLTVTSYGNRTAPVIRGKYVLGVFLGNPPPPPPPDVPALTETETATATMRQRMEQHRANPVCANCHRLMDPIGFAMENYDAIGRYRTAEDGVAIDASGTLADGTKINGVNDLRKAILSHPELFVRTFTESLTTYAIGRALGPDDMPSIRAIVRESAGQNYTLESLIQGIVHSTPFQMKLKESAAPAKPGAISTVEVRSPAPVVTASNTSH